MIVQPLLTADVRGIDGLAVSWDILDDAKLVEWRNTFSFHRKDYPNLHSLQCPLQNDARLPPL